MGPSSSRILGIMLFILIAAAMRLIPHPPNFTPIAAMALFGGAYLANKRWALVLPLIALLISDMVLGFHDMMPAVYASFLIVGVLGMTTLSENRSAFRVGTMSLAGSVLFFVITNFAVWAQSGMYPLSTEGLIQCFVMALPFFHYTLAGDFVFNAALFGGFALAAKLVNSGPQFRKA